MGGLRTGFQPRANRINVESFKKSGSRVAKDRCKPDEERWSQKKTERLRKERCREEIGEAGEITTGC